jgi:hypothetical protein
MIPPNLHNLHKCTSNSGKNVHIGLFLEHFQKPFRSHWLSPAFDTTAEKTFWQFCPLHFFPIGQKSLHIFTRLGSMLRSQISAAFANFWREKWRFLKNKYYDPKFAKNSSILSKKPPFFRQFLAKIFLNHPNTLTA